MILVRHTGHLAPTSATLTAHLLQKQACPHGTNAEYTRHDFMIRYAPFWTFGTPTAVYDNVPLLRFWRMSVIIFTFMVAIYTTSKRLWINFYPCSASAGRVYPPSASDAWVLAVIVCLSVCLCVCASVTRWYCIKTAKRRITQTMPRDSRRSLVS